MSRYKGGSRSREEDVFDNTKLRPEWVTPQLARAKYPSDAVLRSEYSRIRAVAQKRLARMANKEEAQETYSQHAGGFPTLAEIGNDRAELVAALGDLTNFMLSKRNSISSIRESNSLTLATLQSHGINVNKSDLREFGKFMNRMKRAFGVGEGSYGSQRIADAWNEIKSRGKMSKSDMQKLMDQAKIDIEKESRRTIGTHRSSFTVRQARAGVRRAEDDHHG